jgi:ribosomal-protein-alanine N-acetyltransferase
MRAADVPVVSRIERAVFDREAWSRRVFGYLLAVFGASRPARGRLWVATSGGGTVLGYVGIELSALGGEADVVNLGVHPAARRHGVGRALLDVALAYCRARRVPLVWLRVRAGNRGARAFYRRCGFVVIGRFRGYYDAPPEDAVLMMHPRAARSRRSGAPAGLSTSGSRRRSP